MLHGQQHACCHSDPVEEQLYVFTPGATVITVLGDSLSSTEGRCNAFRPWPMLLQDSLGADSVTVHGFAQPGISARLYQGSEVWSRAVTTRPDVLAIMLGTNDGHRDFDGADFKRRVAALVGTFPRVPMNRLLLISPLPLWKDGVQSRAR